MVAKKQLAQIRYMLFCMIQIYNLKRMRETQFAQTPDPLCPVAENYDLISI